MIPSAWKSWLGALLLATCLWSAAADATPDDPDAALAAARDALTQLERRLAADTIRTGDLPDIRRRLLEWQQRADAIATEQAPLLESAKGRLAELGATPAEGEAPAVAEQRKSLQATVTKIDARTKLARLLALTSEQLADTAGAQARQRFAAELFEPTDPLLGAEFRRSLSSSLPVDAPRVERAVRQLRALVDGAPAWSWLAVVAASLAALGVRHGLTVLLRARMERRTPHSRLRRSLLAFTTTMLSILVPGVAALSVRVAYGDAEAYPAWTALLSAAVGMACFCAYVCGLGRALLAPQRPTWRLPKLQDPAARRLRYVPAWLGWMLFTGWLLTRMTEVAQLSLPVLVAVQAGVAMVLALALARLTSWGRRVRIPWWLRLLSSAIGLMLVGVVVAMLAGYVALGRFVVGQAIWSMVLLCTGYLLFALIDDALTAWAAASAGPDEVLPGAARPRQQAAVLASGLLRLLVLLVLLVLALAPFGEGPGELLGRGLRLREGITIGELQLQPGALLQALLVAVLVFAAVRLVQRWLARRLLPTTRFDLGLQNSLVTLLGFIGSVVAVAMGLSAMGLALNQVAWIASALTVGIGFGLQAVVSNFVSGLILLAERPVKVGDWVALGPLEGDIRRINVRTTEIQMADRSTIIVPNSEFITKVVRNVTHDPRAQGLVQLRLPMPLDCDAEHVRATLLAAFHAHEHVLEEPAPTVLLDGIEADKLVFNATGFVASPRRAALTRSELLFRVLGELKQARPEA